MWTKKNETEMCEKIIINIENINQASFIERIQWTESIQTIEYLIRQCRLVMPAQNAFHFFLHFNRQKITDAIHTVRRY